MCRPVQLIGKPKSQRANTYGVVREGGGVVDGLALGDGRLAVDDGELSGNSIGKLCLEIWLEKLWLEIWVEIPYTDKKLNTVWT